MTGRHRFLAGLAFTLCLGPGVKADPLGDAERGATLFQRQCAACHQVGPDAVNRIGPHLNGVFGRKAGGLEGFRYSKPMQDLGAEGTDWTIERLDAYIENPRGFLPGTRMSFRGMKDAADRGALIAYLRNWSDQPQDIPESAPTANRTEPRLPPEILAIEGDAEYGEYLSSECSTCHKRDGSDDGIPSILNWPEEDFVAAMHEYKSRLRPHPVMQMMAGRLSNEEIAALAAYYATYGE